MPAWTCGSCGGENPEGMRFCGHCGAPAEAAAAAETAATEADVTSALRSFVAGAVADRLVEAGGELPEERRLITALFADVSGFTSLADRLDPEDLLEVIDPVISGLSSIVGRYDGYVEKFAGDALLALFGAPVAHEDDAARALLVALEMHRDLARMCEELPHQAELTLHVGVNSGHGIARILGSEARMDYAVLGDSVILAQRLESAAPSGETYVSELTQQLTQDRFEFEPVGELTLKGKSEPVFAWRLVGDRRGPIRRVGDTALLGRREELAVGMRLLESLAGGLGGVLCVTGEPGIGKSRLTEEVRRQASERLVRWLHARCVSYGAGLAYWPYAELLRAEARIEIDDAPEEAAEAVTRAFAGVPRAVPYFLRLLGLPGSDDSEIASLEPEAFRRGLHDAFADWLRSRAAEGPTVLALEDAHWADTSSLALTRELAELCADEALALYLIARPEALSTLKNIAPSASTMIELAPLDESAVEELVEHTLGGAPPEGLSKVVLERTQGNPFFVQELVRAYRDTGALARDDGRWRMRRGWEAEAVPPTIEGVLAARIDLLPRNAANALQTASVIGRRVRLPLLAKAAPELPDLVGSIDRLVSDGFLDRADGDGEETVLFHHALVQDVAYSRLLRRRRRDLHRRVAEVAEELYGAGDDTIDLLARHLYLGEAGAKAVDYLVRAGERAKRLYANEEAILHYARAAEVASRDTGTRSRSGSIQLALGELHELVGDYEEALRVYRSVRDETGDVAAWRGLASVHRSRGEYREALELIDEAFRRDELRSADVTPLWLEQGRTLCLAGRIPQAIEVFEAGLVSRRGRRDELIGHVLLQLARAETLGGRFESALGHASEAKAIFEDHTAIAELATTARVLGDVYRNLGRLDDAAATLHQGLELARRTGNAEEIGGCLINLTGTEIERERLPEAAAVARDAIEQFERIGHGSGRAGAYASLAYVLALSGDYDEAEEAAEQAIEISRAIGNTFITAEVVDTLAFIARRRGLLARAAELAEEAAQLFLDIGAAPRAADALEIASEAWAELGDEEQARMTRSRARSAFPRDQP
jgi:adenylate cyclase